MLFSLSFSSAFVNNSEHLEIKKDLNDFEQNSFLRDMLKINNFVTSIVKSQTVPTYNKIATFVSETQIMLPHVNSPCWRPC